MNEQPVAVMKALADPARWRIVSALALGPMTTGALAEPFEMTRFGVMKHLEVLVEAGLVVVERRGRERWNHLNPAPLAGVLDAVTTPLGRQWAHRLVALRNAVETRETDMASPGMIEIRQELQFAATPQRVFDVLTREIDLWWTSPYRLTEGGRVVLEARAGGMLREETSAGHVAIWAHVEEIDPGRLLVLSGTIGMASAVAGRVRFELASQKQGCTLLLTHLAIGPVSEETRQNFDAGWNDLLGTRLRARIEGK
jgi:DNA-binding transcriptional ArsR family regulator/uncharacterized protein YndB with AHSA1/START domain